MEIKEQKKEKTSHEPVLSLPEEEDEVLADEKVEKLKKAIEECGFSANVEKIDEGVKITVKK